MMFILAETKEPCDITLDQLFKWKGDKSEETKQIIIRLFEFELIKNRLDKLLKSQPWRSQTCVICQDCFLEATTKFLYPRGDIPPSSHQAPVIAESVIRKEKPRGQGIRDMSPEMALKVINTIIKDTPSKPARIASSALPPPSTRLQSGAGLPVPRLPTGISNLNTTRERSAGYSNYPLSARLLSPSTKGGVMNLKAVERHYSNRQNKLPETRPYTAYEERPKRGSRGSIGQKEPSADFGSTRIGTAHHPTDSEDNLTELGPTPIQRQRSAQGWRVKTGQAYSENTDKSSKGKAPVFKETMDILGMMKSKIQQWDLSEYILENTKAESKKSPERKQSRTNISNREGRKEIVPIKVTKSIDGIFEGEV